MVHPQVCSLFLLKALELGIFLGLPIESIGYTFFVVAIVIGLQTYLFYNPHFLSPIVKFYVTVFICDYFFSHYIKGHLTKFTKEPCIVTPTSSGMWPCRWSLFYLARFRNKLLGDMCLHPSTIEMNRTVVGIVTALKK